MHFFLSINQQKKAFHFSVAENQIDKTAIVSPKAELDGVEIGRFCVVEEGVKIGKGTKVGDFTYIRKLSDIGKDNVIADHVSIGRSPFVRGFDERIVSGVLIGNANVILQNSAIHRAKQEGLKTQIGDRNFLNGTHISHDNVIGNDNVIDKYVMVMGHVVMGDHVHVEASVGIHQFCFVGSYSKIEAFSKLDQNLIPFTVCSENGKMGALDEKRFEGFDFLSKNDVEGIDLIHRKLFKEGKTVRQAVSDLNGETPLGKYQEAVIAFCKAHVDNKRGFLL